MKRVRIPLLLLSLIFAILLIPCLAQKAGAEVISGNCQEDGSSPLNWTLDLDTGILTVSGEGSIPMYYPFSEDEEINGDWDDDGGYSYSPWRKYRNCVNTIVLQEGVRFIGARAFSDFVQLKTIWFPSTVTGAGDSAFDDCRSIKEVHIADLGSWSSASFSYWYSNPLVFAHALYVDEEQVTDVVIPEGVTKIGANAFKGCSTLSSITIPDTVSTIEHGVFDGCTGLKGVYISDIASWCGTLFRYPSSNPLYYAHQLYLNGEKVSDLTIPEGVTRINTYAFESCTGLSSVTIPASVTSIGGSAFYACTGLSEVSIPGGVTSIGDSAFSGCKCTVDLTITDPARTYIGKDAFLGDGVKLNLDLIGTVDTGIKKKIGKDAITSVTLGPNVTALSANAFSSCPNLTAVTFNQNLTEVGKSAFYGCESLCQVFAPTVASWLRISFSNSSANPASLAHKLLIGGKELKELTIPVETTALGSYQFYGCSDLVSVTIPDSVETIGSYAFLGCSGLEAVQISSLKSWLRIRFENAASNPLSYGHKLYLNHEPLSHLEIQPSDVTVVNPYTFYHCSSLKSVVIGDGIVQIMQGAFAKCKNLTRITFGADLSAIHNDAFTETSNVRDITIHFKNITATCFRAFYYNLNTVVVTDPKCLIEYEKNTLGIPGKTVILGARESTADYYSRAFAYDFFKIPSTFLAAASNSPISGAPVLNWGKVEGADCYRVYRSETIDGEYRLMKTTTERSYINTTVETGKPYYYKVRAMIRSAWFETPVVSCTAKLPRPSVTTSCVTATGKPKLTWKKVPGAVSYKVYRAASETGSYSLKATVTAANWTDTTAVGGKTYWYKVKAVHSDSNANSACSSVRHRTCKLPQPTITLSNSEISGAVVISWKKVPNAVSYRVYRATSKDGTYSVLKNVTSGLSFTNSSVTPGKVYYYRVVAVAQDVNANSSQSSAKYRTAKLARPSVTSSLTSGGKPKLSWKKVNKAVKYQVYRSTREDGTYSLKKTTTSTTWTDTTAKTGKTYYYKVKAIHSNTNANSAYSAVRYRTCK